MMMIIKRVHYVHCWTDLWLFVVDCWIIYLFVFGRYDTLPQHIDIDNILENKGLKDLMNQANPAVSKNITSSKNITDSRNTNSNSSDNLSLSYSTNASSAENVTSGDSMHSNNLTVLIQEVIVNDTDIYLPNLEHFQEYSIEVSQKGIHCFQF